MFRGKIKLKNNQGQPVFYSRGDIVLDQGRVYSCQESTIQTPLQAPKKWKLTELNSPYQGNIPPKKPIKNQMWVADNGRTYVWYSDDNSSQWIET
jgi:hypothetical protein